MRPKVCIGASIASFIRETEQEAECFLCLWQALLVGVCTVLLVSCVWTVLLLIGVCTLLFVIGVFGGQGSGMEMVKCDGLVLAGQVSGMGIWRIVVGVFGKGMENCGGCVLARERHGMGMVNCGVCVCWSFSLDVLAQNGWAPFVGLPGGKEGPCSSRPFCRTAHNAQHSHVAWCLLFAHVCRCGGVAGRLGRYGVEGAWEARWCMFDA